MPAWDDVRAFAAGAFADARLFDLSANARFKMHKVAFGRGSTSIRCRGRNRADAAVERPSREAKARRRGVRETVSCCERCDEAFFADGPRGLVCSCCLEESGLPT